MAKGKVQGLTIEIGADTTSLSKALKGTNKEIKSTQKELKEVEKGLKLDPRNVALLERKQKLLGEAVEQNEKKFQALKTAQEKFIADGGKVDSKQYAALTLEIQSTERSLKEAQQQAAQFNVNLAKVKGTADIVASKANNIAESTRVLSTAAAGALAGIAGLGIKAAQTADDLNTLSEQTGLSTEELQKMQFAAELIDVPTENITSSLQKLKRNMASTSEETTTAWNRIGVSVRDSSGQYKSAEEVFYSTLEGLSRISDETERDILAMQLFGRSAADLTGVIDDGGAALKAYGQQAQEMGVIMSQETLDALNEVNDTIDLLKAQFKGDLAVSGAKAMEALLPVFQDVTAAIKDVLTWIGNLDESQIKLLVTVLAVVAAISPIAKIIATVSMAVSGVATAIGTLGPAIAGIKAAATGLFSGIGAFFAANPIVLIIAAIVAAVIALTVIIVKNWDKIKAVLEQIWTKIKDVFEKIKTKAVEIWTAIVDGVKSAINKVIEFINKGIEGINKITEGINGMIEKLNGFFGSNIGKIGQIGTIPLLAQGGILKSGSAIVGEKGPELLSMVGGEAVVRPLANNTTNQNYSTSAVYNYNFTVDNFETFRQIEYKLENERRTRRMGYVGG